MIVTPAPGSEHIGPAVCVEGWAWSCDSVQDVSISADEGQSWINAAVDSRTEFSWQRFRATLHLSPGSYTVLARAKGLDGRMQPLGEGRNHVHRVAISVT